MKPAVIHPPLPRHEPDSHPDPADAADLAETLLPLALSQPRLALTRATQILATAPSAYDASVAHQAAGIVHREAGDVEAALTHLRQARRAARRCAPEVAGPREGDVLATYAVALQYAGRTVAALRAFTRAEPLTPPARLSRLLLRRAHVEHRVGRYAEALADLDLALAGSRAHGDPLWEARALNNRADVHLALGAFADADADAVAAEEQYRAVGAGREATEARHNRAYAAMGGGDLPRALALLEEVGRQYEALGDVPPELGLDRAEALLVAGLSGEAVALTRTMLTSAPLPPLARAETLLLAARALRQAGDLGLARDRATQAARLFGAQRRPTWALRARLLGLQAERDDLAGGDASRTTWARVARAARAVAAGLDDQGLPETPVALLLHGQAARLAGHDDEALASLRSAADGRRAGPPLARAAGWYAAALLADAQADRRALLHACRRGLDAVDEHRATFGDLELRALAGDHGLGLARLAVTDAVHAGRPREVLRWAERWRATALSGVDPPADDPALAADVAALRDVTRRLGSAQDDAGPSLAREQARLEAGVRRRQRHRRGVGATSGPVDLTASLERLGDTTLLYLVEVEGTLLVLTAREGRVRSRVVGPAETAGSEATYATFALRRAAHGRPLDLAATGHRLQAALLGEVGEVGERVVVVPPAALLSAPWSLLPALSGSVLTVAPSLSAWHRAHETASSDGPVVLVTGPGLTTEQQEASMVGGRHVGVVTLGDSDASVERALAALDGARLGHVAAHGHLRTDAPLFSAIDLADGPLMVHDLQRLARPPSEMVLSACESAGMLAVTSDEALGLVSALLAMGTRSVVASVAPVNDRATVDVMGHVHAAVAAGGSLASGLRDARTAPYDDPVGPATAASFTAWGA